MGRTVADITAALMRKPHIARLFRFRRREQDQCLSAVGRRIVFRLVASWQLSPRAVSRMDTGLNDTATGLRTLKRIQMSSEKLSARRTAP